MSKLVANITNSKKSVKGLKPLAYCAYRSDVALTIVDNKVTAVVAGILGVIEGCKFFMNAGGEEVVAEDNFNGFKHKINIIANKGSESIDGMDDVVFFVETTDGTKYVLGAKYGMWKTAQSAMTNDNLGAIALEFTSREGMEETAGDYFLVADISAIPTTTNYEAIEELTIGNGQITPKKIYLKVDSNKTCYVVLPSGALLTSTSGTIDYDYTGVAGAVKLVVPKNSVNFIMYDGINAAAAAFVGEINLLGNYGYVDTRGCFGITYLLAHNALIMLANNCDLSALSVANQLLAFKENNPTYAGMAVFSNNTDANSASVNAELILKGTNLNDVVATELVTWAITIDGY
jgi:hypothetical protein